MDRESLHEHIVRQRLALADLLDTLEPQQWDLPSLCSGWLVRDVAAHVTLSTRVRPKDALVGLVKARGSFNRYVYEDAIARRGVPPQSLIEDLRARARSTQRPPGTKPEDPLVDVLVHTQDIAVPLGIERAVPPDAGVAAADRVWGMGFPFRARKRLADVRLRATDAGWEKGDGAEVSGPIGALLLLLTGRDRALEQLEGDGVGVLRERGGLVS